MSLLETDFPSFADFRLTYNGSFFWLSKGHKGLWRQKGQSVIVKERSPLS
ncbi:MAG: hypothetical protein LBJ67_13095 [Planctomycetaceae bacterium]|nr:hypothetical protein [Planctomycetaceae bacterium]